MRTRNKQIILRLNDEELNTLDAMVARTNLSRESFLRKMIAGYRIVEKPDIEYFEILKQLRYIGNNVRQIAIRAHAIRHIDSEKYEQYADELCKTTNELAAAVNRHRPKGR